MAVIILEFWHLFNVSFNRKFVPRIPNLVSIYNFSRNILYLYIISVYIHHIWLLLTTVRLSGDIEENPRNKR